MSTTSTLSAAASTAREKWAEPAANRIPGSGGPVQRAAQAGTIISVVVIGVIALVGVLIFAQINDALPTDVLYNDPTNETDPTALGNASTSVTDGFAGAMELVPIVMLVLVAALVIAVVQRMRGSGGM
ncbi:MAG: hypothetical protein RI560_08905 [Natronomonas sp.]|nr:hypothetical protein [Natronomonas sp.]